MVLQWIQLKLLESLLQILNSKTFVVLKVLHLLRNLAFLLSLYQQQPELLQKLQLTTLSQTLKENVNSFVLIHTICQLLQLLTRIWCHQCLKDLPLQQVWMLSLTQLKVTQQRLLGKWQICSILKLSKLLANHFVVLLKIQKKAVKEWLLVSTLQEWASLT